jgi:hypothetical protein
MGCDDSKWWGRPAVVVVVDDESRDFIEAGIRTEMTEVAHCRLGSVSRSHITILETYRSNDCTRVLF